MMRAETYDELAELETLLDEYARLEVLDPPKLPALAARIWSAIERGEPAGRARGVRAARRPRRPRRPHRRLPVRGQGHPDQGRAARARPRARGRAAARAGRRHAAARDAATCPGCGGRWGRRTGSTSRRWWRRRARPARRCRRRCSSASRVRRPATATRVDRLEAAQAALLAELAARGLGGRRRGCLRARRAGRRRRARAALRRRRGRAAHPRAPDEIAAIVAALHGRHVPAGPSGSPTRGRVDVLPTGRNFYSVDPRALPSELSWDVGRRAGRRAARAPPARDRRAAADGRARRLGHVGDAHPGRRRGRDPGPARRAPGLASGERGASPGSR